MPVQYATLRRIESVWTLSFEVIGDKVKVLSYDRENPIGYDKEKELPHVKLVEDEQRNITGIELTDSQDLAGGKKYEVMNPQYIFSYSK
jgi:hypothetical protein